MRALALLFALAASDDAPIVLPPVESGPARLLIFMPGGKVPNADYAPTAKAIQAAAKGISVTVVIPAVFQRLCIIQCSGPGICAPLKGAVDAAVAAAKGNWTAKETFLAGHSLGSTCANYLMQAYNFPYAGLIATGGYVDEAGKGSLAEYPVPVLTLGGDLDGGLARPGKLALWYKQAQALADKPVVVLPGVDHSDFCPGFAVPGDLPSEVPQAAASAMIGEAIAAFLSLHTLSETSAAKSTLAKLQAASEEIMRPVLDALELESAGVPSTTVGLFAPGKSSPWCARAQHLVAGLAEADAGKLEVLDAYFPSGQKFEHSRTHYELLPDGRLRVNSTSHCAYDGDFQNVGERYAAKSLACKLQGADRIAEQLKVATDGNVTCSDVNKAAVAQAEAMLPPKAKARYDQKGRKFCFLEDKPITIGPLFVLSDITLEDRGSCLAVQALSLVSHVDSHIFPGVHYCKVLTPARALDWMMTDSLQPGKGAAQILVV